MCDVRIRWTHAFACVPGPAVEAAPLVVALPLGNAEGHLGWIGEISNIVTLYPSETIIGDLDCPIKSGNDSTRTSLMHFIRLHPSSPGLTGGSSPFISLKCYRISNPSTTLRVLDTEPFDFAQGPGFRMAKGRMKSAAGVPGFRPGLSPFAPLAHLGRIETDNLQCSISNIHGKKSILPPSRPR